VKNVTKFRLSDTLLKKTFFDLKPFVFDLQKHFPADKFLRLNVFFTYLFSH